VLGQLVITPPETRRGEVIHSGVHSPLSCASSASSASRSRPPF
jgi:hypothetical protein